jgi:penicillin-binding protein 2
MIFNFKKRRRNRSLYSVDPDEIFLDSKNLPNFNTQQFEGRIEKPISKNVVSVMSFFFIVIGIVFTWRVGILQIKEGDAYLKRSENNTLARQPIFSDRGLIYDRNQVLLAWNDWGSSNNNKFDAPIRSYIRQGGFSHLLGYVSIPSKDESGRYWQDGFIGKDGVEKVYNDFLTGVNGVRITETDVRGIVHSENIVSAPTSGGELYLAVDSRVQKKLYDSIVDMATNARFRGGAGMFMDVHTGEVLAITSYPEYNSEILSLGQDKETINQYLRDTNKVFLNRAVAGVYTPGSILKPFVAYGALMEKVISPHKKILSNGTLEIPNPYFPDQKSIFKDHGVFGYVDMMKAIAVSSDVYFYVISGGYRDQKGMGILNIDKYSRYFGLEQKTGIDLLGEKEGSIPNPEWKLRTFKGDPWRLGDTYNSSIGQYGFQVTLAQMARATAAIANGGYMVTPHVVKDNQSKRDQKYQLKIDEKNMEYIKEGMRLTVTEGTGRALDLPNVAVAAKSGTAQIGYGNTNVNSWIIGYFPYEKPKYAFVVMMDGGPKTAGGNATRVASQVIDYMKIYTPEYFD